MTDRLDVGFVPAECPGAEGTGATRTSSLLIERLSRDHDLTVYVVSQMAADEAALPARDRVDYVLHDDLPTLPHPIRQKLSTLRGEADALAGHDLVHSYSSAFIPVLADLQVPTLATLNSYLPACPKEDLRYHDERKCSGPAPLKCANCVLDTRVGGNLGVADSLRATYSAFGKFDYVRRALDSAPDVTAFQAISPHLRSDYGALGVPMDSIEVVPHFYEDAFLDLEDHGTDPDASLLYVGRLQENKGPQVLVRALATLRERGHDATLRVAGEGPQREALAALAADLGVESHVTWLGYVDHADLVSEYRTADVFVYPGLLDEPFGRVLLEALGMRTPVVASDVGSMDYIVGPGGELFPPGDDAALAAAVEDVLGSYTTYHDAIPDHVDRFAPDRVVASLSGLYRRTAGTAREVFPGA